MEEYILKFEELGLVPGKTIQDKRGTVWTITGIEFSLNRNRLIPYLKCQTTEDGKIKKRGFSVGTNTIGKTIFIGGNQNGQTE